ncbi:MAG: LamG-like jellyroll fold domain-containing protein [Verrucomicrobiota bacterium]
MKKIFIGFFAAGCIFVQIVPLSGADVRVGLVSYWPLDSVDATTTADFGFGNHLVLNNMGSTNLVASPHGMALTFNGSSTYLGMVHTNDPATLTNNLGLPIYSAKRYTVMAWVKGAAAQNNRVVFAEGSSSSGNPFLLVGTRNGTVATPSGGVNASIRPNSTTPILPNTLSSNIAFDDNWHHIAWVDDNGVGKMYIDGLLDAAVYNYTPATFNLNTISVGALLRTTVANFFSGTIDEVALWERALTQAEIQEVVANGIVTPIPVFAPTITSFSDAKTNYPGDHARFTVTAFGPRPLTYQWKRDGIAILDATNQTYTLFHVTTSDSGATFTVDVTNAGGTTSSNSVLTVLADAPIDVRNGLLSFWPFEVATNTPPTTPDLYSQNHLTLVSTNPAVTFDSNNLTGGQFGQALAFDGIGQYAPRSTGLPIYNNTNYSVSLWVKGNGTTNGIGAQTATAARVFSEASTNGNNPLFSIATDTAGTNGVATMFVRNDANSPLVNGRKSTRIVFNDAWHHVVWVDSNGQGKLYVDGVQDETDFFYIRGILTLNTTTVGGILRGNPYAPLSFFNGRIDEPAVWSRALSISEINDIRANGVPPPIGAIAPSIVLQPVDKTNNVFAGDTVTFSVQANGTSPLSYQWNRNGSPISAGANPTATNNVLILTNVQPAASGNFSVTVTNVAGSTNSITVQLTVVPYTPSTNGEVLKLDFDDDDVPNVNPASGFSSMTLGASGTNFNGVGITFAPLGSTTLDDRDRRFNGNPNVTTNNPPLITHAEVYGDFIFSTSASTDPTGLQILIHRLAPNTQYGLTVWSWDKDNVGDRIADWVETASGVTVPIATPYTFNGSTPILHDYDATFGALLTSSPTGQLRIEGRKSGGSTLVSIFVNALRLVANPVMRITNAEHLNGNLRLTIETQYPGQVITIQEKTDLGSGTWSTPTSGGVLETHGPIVIAEFPAGASQTFYRVTSP